MTSREMAVRIEGAAGVESAEERFGNQIEVRCAPDAAVGFLSYLKASGFEHLSNVTAVDWIEEGSFEIVYNLFSYSHRLHATVKARVDRQAARISTIQELWPQAQVYEREVHEFFGVDFVGNPDLAPFFLHNWHDIPPLRKDFNTEEYSRRAYGMLEGDGQEEQPA